jgi:hypothetical protein
LLAERVFGQNTLRTFRGAGKPLVRKLVLSGSTIIVSEFIGRGLSGVRHRKGFRYAGQSAVSCAGILAACDVVDFPKCVGVRGRLNRPVDTTRLRTQQTQRILNIPRATSSLPTGKRNGNDNSSRLSNRNRLAFALDPSGATRQGRDDPRGGADAPQGDGPCVLPFHQILVAVGGMNADVTIRDAHFQVMFVTTYADHSPSLRGQGRFARENRHELSRGRASRIDGGFTLHKPQFQRISLLTNHLDRRPRRQHESTATR